MVSRQNYSKNRRNSQINKTPIRMVILQTIASSNFLHFSMFLKLFSCLFEMRAGRKYRVSRFDQQFLGHNRLFYCRKAFLSNFQQWILQRPTSQAKLPTTWYCTNGFKLFLKVYSLFSFTCIFIRMAAVIKVRPTLMATPWSQQNRAWRCGSWGWG